MGGPRRYRRWVARGAAFARARETGQSQQSIDRFVSPRVACANCLRARADNAKVVCAGSNVRAGVGSEELDPAASVGATAAARQPDADRITQSPWISQACVGKHRRGAQRGQRLKCDSVDESVGDIVEPPLGRSEAVYRRWSRAREAPAGSRLNRLGASPRCCHLIGRRQQQARGSSLTYVGGKPKVTLHSRWRKAEPRLRRRLCGATNNQG